MAGNKFDEAIAKAKAARDEANQMVSDAKQAKRNDEMQSGLRVMPYCTAIQPHHGKLVWNGKTYQCECGQVYAKDATTGGLREIELAGGSYVVVSALAATAVVNYNLLQNRPDVAVSSQNRALSKLGLTGSAAAGDTAVDMRIANVTVISVFNTNTGVPSRTADVVDVGPFPVYAGDPLSGIVTDAAATNPIYLAMDI